jgi:phasin
MSSGPNTPNYEIPSEMREFAERSVDQARKAMDGFVGAAQRAVETIEGSATTVGSSAKDMRSKTFSYAEQNLQAAFDHAQKLVRAKDPTEFMRLQAEFMQTQFQAMQSQMRELGVAVQGAATKTAGTTAPKK